MAFSQAILVYSTSIGVCLDTFTNEFLLS